MYFPGWSNVWLVERQSYFACVFCPNNLCSSIRVCICILWYIIVTDVWICRYNVVVVEIFIRKICREYSLKAKNMLWETRKHQMSSYVNGVHVGCVTIVVTFSKDHCQQVDIINGWEQVHVVPYVELMGQGLTSLKSLRLGFSIFVYHLLKKFRSGNKNFGNF